MKQLIVKSIKIHSGSYLTKKTIFNIKNEMEKQSFLYISLINIKGLKTMITFEYTEDDIKKSDKIQLTIPEVKNEEEIKDFILSEITKFLETK